MLLLILLIYFTTLFISIHLLSQYAHLSSLIPHLSSLISHPSSLISHLSSLIRHAHAHALTHAHTQVTDKVTTAELQAQIAKLSFTEYAEKNFNYDRKGIFGMKTTTEKITSWKGGRDLIKVRCWQNGY